MGGIMLSWLVSQRRALFSTKLISGAMLVFLPQTVLALYCGGSLQKLNVNQVNVLAGLACSTYSHMLEERTARNQWNGANRFHSWNVSWESGKYKVKGVCSSKYDLRTQEIIDHGGVLELEIASADWKVNSPRIQGTLGGKNLEFQYQDRQFYKSECQRVVTARTLQRIQVGTSLFDYLSSHFVSNAVVIEGPSNRQSWPASTYLNYSDLNLLYTWRPTQVPIQGVLLAAGKNPNQFLVEIEDITFRTSGNEDGAASLISEQGRANHVFQTWGVSRTSYLTRGCSTIHRENEAGMPSRLDWQECEELMKQVMGY